MSIRAHKNEITESSAMLRGGVGREEFYCAPKVYLTHFRLPSYVKKKTGLNTNQGLLNTNIKLLLF